MMTERVAKLKELLTGVKPSLSAEREKADGNLHHGHRSCG